MLPQNFIVSVQDGTDLPQVAGARGAQVLTNVIEVIAGHLAV